MSLIEDGKGRGFVASVDSFNRFSTRAQTQSDLQESSTIDEKAYIFSTDFIPIGITGTEVAVLFIKHTGDSDFRINNIDVSNNTGCQWRVYRNPINIAIGTASTGVNLNFGSTKTFAGETIIGTSAAVMTGISALARVKQAWNGEGQSRLDEFGAINLGQNESIGITVQCSSTAIVGCTIIGHDIEPT